MKKKELKLKLEEYSNYEFSSLALYNKAGEDLLNSDFELFCFANDLINCCKYSHAEIVLKKINTKNIPKDHLWEFYQTKGFLYFEWGKYKKAKGNFLKSIKLNCNSTVPHVYLSNILGKEEKVLESIKVLKEGLLKNGDTDEIYFNLGTRYAILGDYQKSLEYLKECQKLDPNFDNVEHLLEDISHCIEII
ncbi:MAG: tetratricopeptide repeat protein [Saprospiraceae bacterium]|nr:tetratricopeptide repeat protein [Saprospiraceae bacterium]